MRLLLLALVLLALPAWGENAAPTTGAEIAGGYKETTSMITVHDQWKVGTIARIYGSLVGPTTIWPDTLGFPDDALYAYDCATDWGNFDYRIYVADNTDYAGAVTVYDRFDASLATGTVTGTGNHATYGDYVDVDITDEFPAFEDTAGDYLEDDSIPTASEVITFLEFVSPGGTANNQTCATESHIRRVMLRWGLDGSNARPCAVMKVWAIKPTPSGYVNSPVEQDVTGFDVDGTDDTLGTSDDWLYCDGEAEHDAFHNLFAVTDAQSRLVNSDVDLTRWNTLWGYHADCHNVTDIDPGAECPTAKISLGASVDEYYISNAIVNLEESGARDWVLTEAYDAAETLFDSIRSRLPDGGEQFIGAGICNGMKAPWHIASGIDSGIGYIDAMSSGCTGSAAGECDCKIDSTESDPLLPGGSTLGAGPARSHKQLAVDKNGEDTSPRTIGCEGPTSDLGGTRTCGPTMPTSTVHIEDTLISEWNTKVTAGGHGPSDSEPWYYFRNSRLGCVPRQSCLSANARKDPIFGGEISTNVRVPAGDHP